MAIELGVQPTKNIHSDAGNLCDKDNETDCATNEIVASPSSRNEASASHYGAKEIVASTSNHDENNASCLSKWTKNNTLLLIKLNQATKIITTFSVDKLNATRDEIQPSLRSGPLSSSSSSSSQSSSTTSLNASTDHPTDKSAKERKLDDNDEAIITPKSKKGKFRRTGSVAAPPDWFVKWNEDNKAAEEKVQLQTKNFQDEILKRLDTKKKWLMPF